MGDIVRFGGASVKKSVLLSLTLFFLVATQSTALLIASFTVSNQGQITSVGITSDKADLNWGSISPGGDKILNVQVTNTGNVAASLSMTTENLPSYISLVWNREGYALASGASIQASFTLTASADAPEGAQFNFNIVLTGMGGE